MNILGIHGHVKREDEELRSGHSAHDAAAVLLRDGVIVAAVEEERLNRLKHTNTFPVRAIQHCLTRAGLSFDELDCIATNRSETSANRAAQIEWLTDPAHHANSGRLTLADSFTRAFGVDVRDKLLFCPHHVAHAWSAFVPSGFGESLVFIADGDGDSLSGLMMLAKGQELITLREYPVAKSLGNLYTLLIGLVGYGRFDEYKVMGLAPYGDRRVFEPVFERCYTLLPEGDYEIAPPFAWAAAFREAGLFDRARRKHQPLTQEHKDFAAALQATIERIVLHVLSFYRESTGSRNLCIAGGVFHNCSVNGAILYSGLFDNVFAQPAAHDAGGAYGAALHAAVHHGEEISRDAWTHVYFGADVGCDRQLRGALERWHELVDIEHIGDSAARPAEQLAQGAVLGWVQGRSEFGPRALGNRSILADPRPPGNKDRINAMVKKREAFRPFAPAVLVERVRDYFEVPGDQADFPFMIFVLRVRPEWREALGAITHVDGTARVQTVSRDANPRFWGLIRAFEARTGVAVLLNTSFNNNAEPIVDSPDDAIGCYLTTGLDVVVIGDYLVRKKSAQIRDDVFERLAPRLAGFRRIVKQSQLDPGSQAFDSVYAVHSTRSRFFGPPETTVSEAAYRMLQVADGRQALCDLTQQAGIRGADVGRVYAEFRRLWTDRVVTLSPAY